MDFKNHEKQGTEGFNATAMMPGGGVAIRLVGGDVATFLHLLGLGVAVAI